MNKTTKAILVSLTFALSIAVCLRLKQASSGTTNPKPDLRAAQGRDAANATRRKGPDESLGPRGDALRPGIAMHTKVEEAPFWSVPYGREFWRPAGQDVEPAAPAGVMQPT